MKYKIASGMDSWVSAESFEDVPEKYKRRVALLQASLNDKGEAFIRGVGFAWPSQDKVGYICFSMWMQNEIQS